MDSRSSTFYEHFESLVRNNRDKRFRNYRLCLRASASTEQLVLDTKPVTASNRHPEPTAPARPSSCTEGGKLSDQNMASRDDLFEQPIGSPAIWMRGYTTFLGHPAAVDPESACVIGHCPGQAGCKGHQRISQAEDAEGAELLQEGAGGRRGRAHGLRSLPPHVWSRKIMLDG